MTVTLDENHIYHLKGRVIPGVTELLKPVSRFYGYSEAAEAARRLGTYIHEACALDDLDDLDEESVSEEVYGYLEAWRNWRGFMGPEHRFTLIEATVYAPQSGYAGTLDRVMVTKDAAYVVDIKTGSPEPWHSLQLYAYARALLESGDLTVVKPRGLAVYLKDDGGFDPREYDLGDETYYHTLLALLRVWKTRKEFGL